MGEPENKQLCTILIAFSVDTDEKAIEYKKKLADLIANMPNVRMEFNLSKMPDISQLTNTMRRPVV